MGVFASSRSDAYTDLSLHWGARNPGKRSLGDEAIRLWLSRPDGTTDLPMPLISAKISSQLPIGWSTKLRSYRHAIATESDGGRNVSKCDVPPYTALSSTHNLYNTARVRYRKAPSNDYHYHDVATHVYLLTILSYFGTSHQLKKVPYAAERPAREYKPVTRLCRNLVDDQTCHLFDNRRVILDRQIRHANNEYESDPDGRTGRYPDGAVRAIIHGTRQIRL
ncbi:hypothetical protein F5Y12DRAFT_712025 [Xylaria sp. FL1777]|nr:hypothetical protein F5Y12DRAFT_712025 [Xylaria sp. FL1777]